MFQPVLEIWQPSVVRALGDSNSVLCCAISNHLIVLGMYLVVITKKKKVGDLLGHAVWKAVDFDIISFKKTVLHLTDNQVGSCVFFNAMTPDFTCCRLVWMIKYLNYHSKSLTG